MAWLIEVSFLKCLWAEVQTYVYVIMRHYAVYVFLDFFSIVLINQRTHRLAEPEDAQAKL